MSSTYAKFIAANDALFKCMEATSADAFNGMSQGAQADLCKAEASAVAGFLQNDQVAFRSLLAERLAALQAKPQ